jgi:CRISPR-associated endonuclease/helicase Cas3
LLESAAPSCNHARGEGDVGWISTGAALDGLDALWAKLPRGGDSGTGYHPLLAHMIDVAQVARVMWREVLPRAAGETIAGELGVSPEVVEGWVSLWAGAHDLGKASPAFARQNAAAWERIRQAGFPCPTSPPSIRAPHGVITASALPTPLTDRLGVPRALGRQVGRLVGGHHGVFPRAEDIRRVERNGDAIGGRSWTSAREELVQRLADLLAVDGATAETARLTNQTVMYLAGLVLRHAGRDGWTEAMMLVFRGGRQHGEAVSGDAERR